MLGALNNTLWLLAGMTQNQNPLVPIAHMPLLVTSTTKPKNDLKPSPAPFPFPQTPFPSLEHPKRAHNGVFLCSLIPFSSSPLPLPLLSLSLLSLLSSPSSSSIPFFSLFSLSFLIIFCFIVSISCFSSFPF